MLASVLVFEAPRFDGEFDLRGRDDLARDSFTAEVIPMMELLEHALGRPSRLRCLEGNTQCLQAAGTGYSAALRHLPRTERISVGVFHETSFEKDRHELVYQETSSHKGDMFTKRLDPNAFECALTLINLVRPDGSKYKAE